MSIEYAIKTLGTKVTTSMTQELRTLRTKRVFKAVDPRILSELQHRSINRSSMFLNEKMIFTREFDKLKARFIAGGNMQDRAAYPSEETSSPTVSLTSFYIVTSVCALERI
jgi:hypothetical protein